MHPTPMTLPAGAPWIQAQPPDARRRAPLPGLAPEGGPGFPCPGEVTDLSGSLFMGSLNRS